MSLPRQFSPVPAKSDDYPVFWSLFPLSWTGLKTLILFFCTTLPVLILRVSQLHVDTRASPSGFHTLKRSVGSFGTYSTLLTYVFASLVFILLYLWSGTKSDLLSFIVDGKYAMPWEGFWYQSLGF